MTTEEVLGLFETDLTNPGSYKSGEFLRDHIANRSEALLDSNRTAVIGALREWILSRSEPQSMVAVSVVGRLRISELEPDIQDLKQDVEAGKFFPHYYLENIRLTLSKL
jgi:hypothetical protein